MNTTTEDYIMELVDQYEPLINKLATKYIRPPRVTREDLCQEGRLATYNAILTYDENFGTSLKTWIYKCVQNAMIAYFQSNVYELHSTAHFQKKDLDTIKEQEKHLVSLDKDFGDDLKLGDTIQGDKSPLCHILAAEENSRITKEIESLPPKERFILENSRSLLGDMTLEEIGNTLNVSKQWIGFSLKKIINKLRANLEEAV